MPRDHYDQAYGSGSKAKPCEGGCGALIPAYGAKKRCPTCAEAQALLTKRVTDARRREKKRKARDAS